MRDFRGKVVLLDFWTYCCINCMHVLPDLAWLEEKYRDEPFAVVGVHSAKFENEQDRKNILSAVHRYEIKHPVIVDRELTYWRAMGVRSWPTLVVVDTQGRVVGGVSGEGQRELLDRIVAEELKRARRNGTLAKTPLRPRLDVMATSSSGLAFPGKVLPDEAGGRLFISDSNHNRIVVTDWPDADGRAKLLTVYGSGKIGRADGPADRAEFYRPQGMALRKNRLYVADTENHLIRAIDLSRHAVRTIAGTGEQAYDRVGGKKKKRQGLNSPWDLVVSGKTLYIAMAGPHQLWEMDLSGGTVRAFVGSGREDIIDGPFSTAALAQPSGLALSGEHLCFADSEVSAIRVANLRTRQVWTIIGAGLFEFGDIDGSYPTARLQHPLGVSVWGNRLLVADTYNHKIKLVDPEARTSQAFIGSGKPGALPANGELSLYEPGGLAVAGNVLFVADTNNHRVVRVDLQTKKWVELAITGLESPTGQ
jgi:thiol-disulfide isomerase/thioredoxin